jgi:hypothetical protein
MSGVGGIIFSIFCGFVFIASGFLVIIYAHLFQAIGIPQVLCLISAILLVGYGILIVLVGKDQIKGIREGKDYPGPSSGIWP